MYHSAISFKYYSIFDQLYPGSHYIIICNPIEYHRIACMVEDDGFEIRDQLIWFYEDKHKSILLARKPCSENPVINNVLKYGTGSINIDSSRISWNGNIPEIGTPGWGSSKKKLTITPGQEGETVDRFGPNNLGRWPANVLHDGGIILNEFSKYGETKSGDDIGDRGTGGIWGKSSGKPCGPQYGDSGSVARYYMEIKTLDVLVIYLTNMITPLDRDILNLTIDN